MENSICTDVWLFMKFSNNLTGKVFRLPTERIRLMRYLLGALLAFSVTNCASASSDIPNAIDLYKLGQRIYSQGTDSCLSCHGIDGAGTDKSDVDLRNPSSWKSVVYENALRSQDSSVETGSVTKAIIALGAKDWNEEHFTIFREHWNEAASDGGSITSQAEPFDEEMVGINGPARKGHEKFIIRAYRKAGLPRPSANQIEDTMAVAVLTYIKRVYASARAQED